METRIGLQALTLLSLLVASPAFAVCTVTITSGPANPTSSTSASFQFSASGCAHGSLQCKLDGGTYATCSSPKSYSGPLSEGAHTFYATYSPTFPPALDTHPWTIDTTAPTTTITSGPPAYTNDPKPTFTFTSNEAGDFKCKVDAGTYATCVSPFTTAKLGEGSHTVSVKAIDVAKNEDATPASSTFEVGRPVADVVGVWLLTDDGSEQMAVSSTGGLSSFLVSGTANTIAHAGDLGGDNFWVLAWDATLRAYDTLLEAEKVNVTPPTTPGGGDIVGMDIDTGDGSVRLGFATKLYHYAEDGTLVRTTTLGSAFRALAVDGQRRQTIVVTADNIVGIDADDGSTVFTISQSGGVGVAVDQFTGEFYVIFPGGMSFSGALRQYDSGGTLLDSYSNSSLNSVTRVGADGFGGAWVATGPNLYNFDVALSQRSSVTPFGANAIAALETDPFNGRVWVAYGTTANGYSNSGTLESTIQAGSDVNDIQSTTHAGFFEPLQPILGSGVQFTAGVSAWVITNVWAASPGEDAGLENDDELVSINGVSAPSVSASDQDLDDFSDAVIAARSGGVDHFVVHRGGSDYDKYATVESLAATYRRAMAGAVGSAVGASGLVHQGLTCQNCNNAPSNRRCEIGTRYQYCEPQTNQYGQVVSLICLGKCFAK